MESKILIFDGECPYCNLASETVQSINDEVMVIDWQDDVVQEFLELQFDTTPFSMVFADLEDSEVTIGDTAAGEPPRGQAPKHSPSFPVEWLTIRRLRSR